jgi:ubiquinone/menaquinone biosynthesis C-methylase UbiE
MAAGQRVNLGQKKMKKVQPQFVDKDYGRLAQKYDQRWRGFNKPVYDYVIKNWPQKLPDKAIIGDLGCGTAQLISKIKNINSSYQFEGFDVCEKMLARAKENLPDAKYSLVNLEEIKPEKDHFDVVLSINVMHHLNDVEHHLEIIRQALNYNGVAIICTISLDTVLSKLSEVYFRNFQPSYCRARSHKENMALFDRLGFCVLSSEPIKPNWFWSLRGYVLIKNRRENPYGIKAVQAL